MPAYIFIVEGVGKIAGYAGVTNYMQAHGVDGRLLPLVILTELGGGLLVLFGLKTRWAAIAPSGYCLLTALLFHLSADQTIHHGRRLPYPGNLRPRPRSLDAWRGRAG
jgi:putative oxidoreductase